MQWAALIAWLVTAGGGFILFSLWIARGGMKQSDEPGSRIRPPLILTHFLLAATGLVIWIIYVVNDSSALAWIALVILGIVALLGWTMFAIWYQRRQAGAQVAAPANPGVPAEQHFPVPIVALHGLAAITTVVLVFLAAVGVGD